MTIDKKGFTLIELLIVMAVIATLVVSLLVNFYGAVVKGRDTKRKQDLQSVSSAMELYYNDVGTYPVPPLDWSSSFVNSSNSDVLYMKKLPSDPKVGYSYCYDSDAIGSYYRLYANLENDKDPNLLESPSVCQTDGQLYNYGVSSSNTSPWYLPESG